MRKKSTCLSYILLVFGGWAGLHLLYLNRDIQAFIYWCTFGGYFGLGPLRDLYRIPTYVREANFDEKYLAVLSQKIRSKKKPPFSVVRFVAQILIGNSWSFLLVAAVPSESIFDVHLKYLELLGPFASSLGVWLVGNIGQEKCSFWCCVLGSYAVLPFAYFYSQAIQCSCVSSAILSEWKGKKWRRTPHMKRSFLRRFIYLSLGWMLFCSLWASYIYFNAEINYNDGEKAKVKDAIHNFFKSPMFLEFKKNMNKLYEDTKEHGWTQAWSNLLELIDPLGEHHALKVLGLHKGASQEEISSKFKALSREWHPDRHKIPEMKAMAQDKFVEIAEAYEKLSVIKKRRQRKNKQSENLEDLATSP